MDTPMHVNSQPEELAPTEVWDNSELLGIENFDGIPLESIYSTGFGQESSFPISGDFLDLDTGVNVTTNTERYEESSSESVGIGRSQNQMFVHVKGTLSSMKNNSMEMEGEEEEEDQYLNFATNGHGSAIGEKVNNWRFGYSGEPMPGTSADEIDKDIQRQQQLSPARSNTSEASRPPPSIAASDSTFVPDALESSSSDEDSLDSDDEEYLPSPISKSQKARGRVSAGSTRPPLKPKTGRAPRSSLPRRQRRSTMSSVGNSPPSKRIKLEPNSNNSFRQSTKRVSFLNDPHAPGNEEDEGCKVFGDITDYGWEYSEYDDLAPIDQILENCTFALDTEFYSQLRFLAFLDENEPTPLPLLA